ncbi:hypothetical protein [Herbaspirillum sp. ST 5-3]|uniref:hypothetical protein n=1 Tax=Oxalobacteraceae TaxID=75682 RepID=UPI0010A3D177|nr:hypothetical protein [Herbaspirillum sp. ST 5-3]
MKSMIVVAMALASSIAFAQQTAPSAASSAQAKQTAPNPAEFDKQMAQVQENMKKMQEQMAKLQQTQNPQERQRLLDDHWSTMQNTMGMMHGMWGPGMMGCCGSGPMGGGHMMGGPMMGGHMGWGGMSDYYSNLTPEQLKQRQYMTDQYLAAQQTMMDHMMWHQRWMGQMPPRPVQK